MFETGDSHLFEKFWAINNYDSIHSARGIYTINTISHTNAEACPPNYIAWDQMESLFQESRKEGEWRRKDVL